MKLKRILSAALAAVVMVNAVTAPVESYAKSPNVEPNVSEATVDYTDYKDKLSSDFYGTLLKMTVVDKESMLNSLTGDELYEVYLLAKYELAHEIIDLKNSKKDFKMEDFFFVTSYFRETFQIAQLSKENAPQNKGAVEKTVAEKLSKKYGKSCNSASSYQAYLQSLTNLNVSELLKQIDTIAFTDTDNEAGMITKFEDYVYATFGFDEWVVGIYENTPTEFKEVSGEPSTEENAEPEKEEGEQAEEKPANLIKQPRALTHKVLDSNKPSFPGENQFSPQFIPGKTHVALSGAPSGAYWDWTGSTIELVTARNVSYQLKSNEKGKYWAKYSNVGIYKGRQVDLKITLTDYSWNSNDSDTKPKRVAFGQQNVGFGYASYNTNMNPKRWARFRMDYTYTDGSKVTGLKGHMAIDDMDYFASSEEIQLLTGNGCESTVYADSTNTNSKIDWSATGNNIIKVKSGVGGKEPQDGGDFVYLFNNPTHEVIWKGAYCNFTQSCPVQEFAVHYIASEASVGVRGPVSIHQGVSLSPIEIVDMQITKSTNSEETKGGERASDTMGEKHFVDFGVYQIKGSVNVQLAEKTGFSQEDAELLKEALQTLFENDASAARPEGSMEVCQLYWWQHEDKTPATSTAKVHRSVRIEEVNIPPRKFTDYKVNYVDPGCIEPEIYDFV